MLSTDEISYKDKYCQNHYSNPNNNGNSFERKGDLMVIDISPDKVKATSCKTSNHPYRVGLVCFTKDGKNNTNKILTNPKDTIFSVITYGGILLNNVRDGKPKIVQQRQIGWIIVIKKYGQKM